MGIPQKSGPGRKEFGRRLELRRWEKELEEWNRVRKGWCLGDDAFRKELLQVMESRPGAEHYGEERRETAEQKAEGIVAGETQEAEVDRAASGTKTQGRREEGEDSETIARRDHDDGGVGTKTHLAHLFSGDDRERRKK
jgi:hypothetical protein